MVPSTAICARPISPCIPRLQRGWTTELGRDIRIRGGELLGAPILTSEAAPKTSIALIDPTGLQVAHDDNVLVSSTEAASVEISDAPTQDALVPTQAQLVSLFQSHSVAFKGVLHASWDRARPDAVAVLQGGAADWMT